MTFEEIVDQAVDMLQRRGRVTYQMLKLQFKLDDETLEALKDELLFSHPVVDQDGRGLLWTGETEGTPVAASQPAQRSQQPPAQQPQPAQVELPPEPSTPDAERRQLTVMFCDLADSTKLSGQLDPEDLRDVIRAYQSTCAEVIERYDGYIAQHLGDGLMVYFGWPQAHEDDAQRAVYAGLGILAAMRQLNARLEQEKGVRLAVRIGIHTGLVVVGEIGQGASQEYLALGETPNVASRIEGIAEPGTVAISDATYQLVQGYFVCEDLGQHTLRGVDDVQQVHRVVRESDAQSRFDVVATRGLTPLVGRESETMLLFERWEQVKEGQGQVILLSGEAGIGKSRLLQVLRDHVAGEPRTRLESRSSPYYQNTALYPITDLLQRVLNCNQDDTPKAKLNSLEQTLREYRFELDEAIPLFANLLSLTIPEDRYPPLSLSPQLQRQKTLAMIVAILLQRAEQQPVLFILEDLHWTDPSTLELMDLLIDQIPTAAICVLLTCRPTFQPSWGSRSYLTPIVISRLSRSQIESMAERVAGGKRLPAEVLQQLVEKTDGVPLFVEEMTKAVLESGALKEVNGQYEPTGSLSALAIPTTLQDSLMARLDRLVTAKGVAQYAAVIGRQFSYALLHAVSQLNERTLQNELQRLVEAELVYQRGLPPQATYTFKHALIQDAAFQSLLKSTRQQYHQRIAQTLETRFPETAETQPELLAHHYTEAGLSETGVTYWQQAGQRAIERFAHFEAISHLTTGLDLLMTLPDTLERAQRELNVQTMLGPLLTKAKGNAAPEVERTYIRAYELCRQIGDTPETFPVLFGLWYFYSIRGELKTAREQGEQLLAWADSAQEATSQMLSHRALGQTLSFMGEMSSAYRHLEQSLSLYDPLQHQALRIQYGHDPAVICHFWAALDQWLLGYPDRALRMSRDGCVLAQELAYPYSQIYALGWTAVLHLIRREGQAAKERAEAAFALATGQHRTAGFSARATILRAAMKAEEASRAGRRERGEVAIAEMRQGIAAWQATGNVAWMPCFLALLGEAYGNVGQPETGLTALDDALAVVNNNQERFYEAELYRLKGGLCLRLSAPDAQQAETYFYQALDIARRQQAKSWELRAATSLARLWQRQGKRQEAYDLLAPVYGWFSEGFDTADLKDAKRLLDTLRN